jgi:hypothetical protein
MAEKPEYITQDGPPPEKPATKEVDAALQFISNALSTPPMSRDDEKRLLRKIDFRIVPLMCLC